MLILGSLFFSEASNVLVRLGDQKVVDGIEGVKEVTIEVKNALSSRPENVDLILHRLTLFWARVGSVIESTSQTK